MEPALRPWTAIIEGPGDLSEGELEVTVAPTAVTSVLFNLDTGSIPTLPVQGGETTDITDITVEKI